LSIDKRTGKRLCDSEVPNYHSQGPFSALAVDRRAGTFDLIAQKGGLRHCFVQPGTESAPGTGSLGPSGEGNARLIPGSDRPVEVPRRPFLRLPPPQ
jgi:hypothetical protein